MVVPLVEDAIHADKLDILQETAQLQVLHQLQEEVVVDLVVGFVEDSPFRTTALLHATSAAALITMPVTVRLKL